MDPLALLLKVDRTLLEGFSKRTIDRLRAVVGLAMVLPHIEPFIAKNVGKEIVKDELVIRYAWEKRGDPVPFDAHTVQRLFDRTKEIDREFLRSITGFSLRINIPYDRVAPLRLQRIKETLDLSRLVMQEWHAGRPVRSVITKPELEQRLLSIFTLYLKETLAMHHSVQLPFLLAPLRDWLARELQRVMNEVTIQLVHEASAWLYRHRSAR